MYVGNAAIVLRSRLKVRVLKESCEKKAKVDENCIILTNGDVESSRRAVQYQVTSAPYYRANGQWAVGTHCKHDKPGKAMRFQQNDSLDFAAMLFGAVHNMLLKSHDRKHRDGALTAAKWLIVIERFVY